MTTSSYTWKDHYALTKQGWLHGEGDFWGNHVFKGIPYAAPPVGKLRFQDPQPPIPWQGIRQACQFGPEAVQFYPGYNEQTGAYDDDSFVRTACI